MASWAARSAALPLLQPRRRRTRGPPDLAHDGLGQRRRIGRQDLGRARDRDRPTPRPGRPGSGRRPLPSPPATGRPPWTPRADRGAAPFPAARRPTRPRVDPEQGVGARRSRRGRRRGTPTGGRRAPATRGRARGRRPASGSPAPAPATTKPRRPAAEVRTADRGPLTARRSRDRARARASRRRDRLGRRRGSPSSGSRKARLRCTGPGRPPPVPPTASARRPGTASDRQDAAEAAAGTPGADGPAHRGPEQAVLFDGLGGADAMELGRPVGGDGEQRHAGLVGLDHRRVQLDGRGPAGGHDRRRPAGRQTQAEGDEAGRALVEHHVDPDPAVGGQGHRAAASSVTREPRRRR